MAQLRVVHYLNQFFAGVGGEGSAREGVSAREGSVGPGRVLQAALGERAAIVGTVFCGDDFFAEQTETAMEQILTEIARLEPDLVIAGPAFNAGRYGLACAQICIAAQDRLKRPAVTGMYRENPAVDMYRRSLYIVDTGMSAAGMAAAVRALATLGLKLGEREPIGPPDEEGYVPRGLRYTAVVREPAAVRAGEMLVKRLRGEPFETEWPLPERDEVPPPPPIADLRTATIALVTSGGIVPKGNPDRIESTFATKWRRYSIAGVTDLSREEWETGHGGFDTTHANEDPNRVLPLDVMREFEAEGTIGKLFDEYFVTVGSGQSTTNARKFAREIAEVLVSSGVDGVILTAT